MSFRTKLVVFALTLIIILALPLAYVQGQRPWRQLYALIDETRARLDGVECAFDREEFTFWLTGEGSFLARNLVEPLCSYLIATPQ